MAIEIDWAEPIALRTLSEKDAIRVREQLRDEPGVYVFARRWGTGFEALYVGQARNIATRVTQQFNNHRLVEHVSNAKTGAKVLLTGYLKYSGYTNIKKALNTAEKAYIRYSIAQGHSLHNKLGTRLKTEVIFSFGGKRTAYPKRIEVGV